MTNSSFNTDALRAPDAGRRLTLLTLEFAAPAFCRASSRLQFRPLRLAKAGIPFFSRQARQACKS
jgi:hypothetical protein